MGEVVCLELSVLLWLAHVIVQAVAGRAAFGSAYLFSSRDTQPKPKGIACGRATRALNNYVENLVPFVAMALGLIAMGRTGASARRSGSSPASSICRSTSRASSTCARRYGA